MLSKHFSKKKDDYDIIVHDYLLMGVNIAATIVGKPVVACYVGHAGLLVPENKKYGEEPELLVYTPESRMPHYFQHAIGVFGAFLWHHLISKEMFYFTTSVQMEYGDWGLKIVARWYRVTKRGPLPSSVVVDEIFLNIGFAERRTFKMFL